MSSINFSNTEVAFKYKNNNELKQAYKLFKLLSNSSLVNLGSIIAPFAVNFGGKYFIKKTIYRQFVGGETREECMKIVQKLAEYNIGSILDYSVEGEQNESSFEKCKNEIIDNIIFSKDKTFIPFCVFKPTGMIRFSILEKVSSGSALSTKESEEWQRGKARVLQVCQKAYESGQPIFIDAEESWIQKAIDDIADECMLLFNKEKPIVWNTFQLYRTDRLEFLKTSVEKARKFKYFFGAKLVRGAYMEKERERAEKMGYPSPIYPDKQSTDNAYNSALSYCVENIDIVSVCAGTHNEYSSQFLVDLMEKKGINKNDKRVFFSQLLGMSDHISFNLAKEGYNVVKYVPYGPVKSVLPYLIRRAQENTSVKGQTGRELSLILKELERRKSVKSEK
ncbi:MAG TPA: proline dehydrogenase family protein [Bacteroidia bacterium]|nr:proline dehydrogenase family protein [Bacteroidia bacterium]